MLPLAHIGMTAFLSTLVYLPASFAVIGALLPDIVDKLLLLPGLSACGRFIGHSLFFGPILSLLAYGLTRKKEVALALLFGSYLHLLEDAKDFMPLFYPIVKYQFECVPTTIKTGPFEIITESLGITLLSIKVLFNSKLLRYRDRLWTKVKTVFSWKKSAS